MNTSKNVCLIPAKAASTRLKKKNILKINGRELIYYPIKAAIDSNLFGNDIFVSSESEEVLNIAERYGATTYKRNEKLAHDPYGVVDVILDFIENNQKFTEYDSIFVLLPTSPMTLVKDIIDAYDIFNNKHLKYLMSVTETDHNAFRSVTLVKDEINPIFPEKIREKSQTLEKTYRVNGAIMIMNIQDFLKTKNYFTCPLGSYVMPRERSIDIDTEFDYNLTKFFMRN